MARIVKIDPDRPREETIEEAVSIIKEGGETKIGIESTVLDLTTSPPTILREGALKREEIEEVVGKII